MTGKLGYNYIIMESCMCIPNTTAVETSLPCLVCSVVDFYFRLSSMLAVTETDPILST